MSEFWPYAHAWHPIFLRCAAGLAGTKQAFSGGLLGRSVVKVDSEVWYTVDQTDDILVFIEDNQMEGVRAQPAPMPDKKEIASDPTLLSEQDHKRYMAI